LLDSLLSEAGLMRSISSDHVKLCMKHQLPGLTCRRLLKPLS